MTDEITTDETEVEAEAGTPDIIRQRQRIKTLEQELKGLREENLHLAFQQAGFDPTKGHGKLLIGAYQGDRKPEAIRKWAEDEYGLKPAGEDTGLEKPPARTEQEQTEVAFEGRLGRARQEAIPPDSDKVASLLAKAREKGDVASEVALQLMQWEQQKAK
jgi:hypothetical protein